MIEVLISPQCMAIMRALRIPPTLVQETVNERDTGCVSDGLDRMIAARWLNEESLILVDSLVSKRTVEHEFTHVRFDQVTAQLAIVLSSNLPAGTVDRQMTMEQILSVVAASFGRPVRCHPQNPMPPCTQVVGAGEPWLFKLEREILRVCTFVAPSIHKR